MIAGFKARFPGVQRFIAQTLADCRAQGYVETLLGRRRYLPDVLSPADAKRAQAERRAINTVCQVRQPPLRAVRVTCLTPVAAVQASAADLMKMVMINVHERLQRPPWLLPTSAATCPASDLPELPQPTARLLLQIHDELLLEVRRDALQDVVQLVRECMETSVALLVPLRAKVHAGPTWGSMVEYEEAVGGR